MGARTPELKIAQRNYYMKNSNYILLGDASIRSNKTTIRAWPDFYTLGDDSDINRLLSDLLNSGDPVAMLWRAKIPVKVLEMFQCFPNCLLRGLLETAQLNPNKFMQLADHCPALVALMALQSAQKQTDRDLDRLQIYAQKRSMRLQLLGLPPTQEAYRILSKLTILDCYPVQLEQLKHALHCKSKRKLLRHLPQITAETLNTLQLESDYLDTHLLSLQTTDLLPQQCNCVADICKEISQFRQALGRFPAWPYKGKGLSLHQLIQSRNKLELELALGVGTRHVRFPKPPLKGIQSSKLRIEPLSSVRDLFHEGNSMQNCIVSYARHTLAGTHYAYKMAYPERATILMVKRADDWYPVEIRTIRNGYPKAGTVDLIHTWAGTILEGKEVTNDFPF